MNQKYARELFNKIKKDFDIIADQFSETRKNLWPELEELREYIKEKERILDLGCGNGRLFEFFKDKKVTYIGIDSSPKLILKAKKKYGNYFKTADILSLPFSNDYFDSIWSIAVFHHIPSKELRLKALKEIRRVLRKGGRVIITCWNFYQVRYFKLLFKFTLSKFFGKSKLDFKDVLIPWKGEGVQRYYHAFTKKELVALFKEARFNIEKIENLKRNNKKLNILIIAKI